jgi:DNA polymerase-3 subunit epsilon
MAGRAVTGLTSLDRYRAATAVPVAGDAGLDGIRFVVLDCETTGLDPATDRIITIGAVGVVDGEIRLDDTFERLVRIDENTSAVTVHGVTRDESRAGVDETEALAAFLDYVGGGIIVGHHIGHDIGTLNAGYARHWGSRLVNRDLDTMDLTLLLERDGAFSGRPAIRHFTLDALCEMFGVVPHDRHTASGDAFITAQIFLRLLRLASAHGRRTVGAITEVFEAE